MLNGNPPGRVSVYNPQLPSLEDTTTSTHCIQLSLVVMRPSRFARVFVLSDKILVYEDHIFPADVQVRVF